MDCGNVALYKDVYNKRVIDYPEWTFVTINAGAHNFALFIWFGTGLLGLLESYDAMLCNIERVYQNGVKNKYRSHHIMHII